jgi:hypothetical protein
MQKTILEHGKDMKRDTEQLNAAIAKLSQAIDDFHAADIPRQARRLVAVITRTDYEED